MGYIKTSKKLTSLHARCVRTTPVVIWGLESQTGVLTAGRRSWTAPDVSNTRLKEQRPLWPWQVVVSGHVHDPAGVEPRCFSQQTRFTLPRSCRLNGTPKLLLSMLVISKGILGLLTKQHSVETLLGGRKS